jgi:hypothetical protein
MNNKILGFIFAGITIISVFLPWLTASTSGSMGSASGSGSGLEEPNTIYGLLTLLCAGAAIGFHFAEAVKDFAAFVMLGAVVFPIIAILSGPSVSGSASYGGYSASASMGPGFGVFVAIAAALVGFFFMFKARGEE